MMWRIPTFVFFVTFSIIPNLLEVHAEPLVPCFFIFGDSLSDAGNNNDLNTKARANYPPYGIDFHGQPPTGRFSNGRTGVDVIAELLGFDGYIPPFRTANGVEILKGVNYASGAAGIRYETSQHLGDRISFDQQIRNHRTTISKLYGMVNTSTRAHLQSCLYTVNIGSNDYINNYYRPDYYLTSYLYTPKQYAESLIRHYSRQIKALYHSGARKVALFGLGFVGCSLAEIVRMKPDTQCVNSMNEAVAHFNTNLKHLVERLNHQLPGSKFTFIDVQSIALGPSQGLTVQNATCCDVREDFQCLDNSTPCENRDSYVFWDGFHTTEAANVVIGNNAFKAMDSLHVHPYDINTLVNPIQQY